MRTFQEYIETPPNKTGKTVIVYELKAFGHPELSNQLAEHWGVTAGNKITNRVLTYEQHVAKPPADKRMLLQKLRRYGHAELAQKLSETWNLPAKSATPMEAEERRNERAENLPPTKRMPRMEYKGPTSPYRIGTCSLEEYHRSAQQVIKERDDEIQKLKAEIRRLNKVKLLTGEDDI